MSSREKSIASAALVGSLPPIQRLVTYTALASLLVVCPPAEVLRAADEPSEMHQNQPPSDEPAHRTGLRPPTEADQLEMRQTLVNTGEVHPNRLGLERINAERAKQGLPPLIIEPAPEGQEVSPKPRN